MSPRLVQVVMFPITPTCRCIRIRSVAMLQSRRYWIGRITVDAIVPHLTSSAFTLLQRLGHARAKHHGFQQRIRGETVRAMHAVCATSPTA